MRARNLKPAFFKNEDLAELPFEYRLLFQGLWCLADKRGRLEDRPKRIGGEVFPYDKIDVQDGLTELADRGLIVRYVADGRKCIAIPSFLSHNHPHKHEKESELPEPPERAGKLQGDDEPLRDITVTRPAESPLLNDESPLIESPLRNDESGIVSSEPDKPASEPPLVIFPVVAPEGRPKTWGLTVAKVTEYQQTYTGVDVLAECRKALQWCRDNPSKRKTAKGMPAFLNRWLEKAQNSGGGTRGHPRQNGVAATIGSYLDKYGGQE